MITKSYELDVELIEALETEMKNKKLPLHTVR